MRSYKVLANNIFVAGKYSIVPIRDEDKYAIMQWRNEQMYHLRQLVPLTTQEQEQYFNKVVDGLFDKELPEQILFSFLENGHCIGYGGLVHINWIDKHAEISFIMNTELEDSFFDSNWSAYLNLIEKVAFKELNFHKIFIYAFDIRRHLYKILEKNGYKLDARLKEHCYCEGEFLDVVIHYKLNSK